MSQHLSSARAAPEGVEKGSETERVNLRKPPQLPAEVAAAPRTSKAKHSGVFNLKLFGKRPSTDSKPVTFPTKSMKSPTSARRRGVADVPPLPTAALLKNKSRMNSRDIMDIEEKERPKSKRSNQRERQESGSLVMQFPQAQEEDKSEGSLEELPNELLDGFID